MFSGGRAGGGGAGSRSKNMKKGAPRPAAGELLSSLFTLNFFANKAMTCRLVRDAPPSSSSPCGEEEERRARCRRRRGLGCKLSRYRAPISALLRGGNCSAVWCKLDLLQRLRPLARWLGACSGLLSPHHGSARKARCNCTSTSTGGAAAEGEAGGIQVRTKFLPCSPHSARSSCRSKGPSSSVP